MATKTATAKKAKKATTATASAAKEDNGEYRAAKIFKSPNKIIVANLPPLYGRADLEFIGVDHSGASFEARVFLNKPDADENTATTEANGYAGSFSIFGHGGCFGDVGHCDITHVQDEFDPRPSHPLEPIKKVVIATDAIKRAAEQSAEISITVVPVLLSWTEQTNLDDVLHFDHINLVTYG